MSGMVRAFARNARRQMNLTLKEAADMLDEKLADLDHIEHVKTLNELARMRMLIKDSKAAEKAARLRHRDQVGQFAKHPDVASHDRLARHIAGPGHSMAILPEWRGSTKAMAIAHEVAHTQRPTDHAVDEVAE